MWPRLVTVKVLMGTQSSKNTNSVSIMTTFNRMVHVLQSCTRSKQAAAPASTDTVASSLDQCFDSMGDTNDEITELLRKEYENLHECNKTE